MDLTLTTSGLELGDSFERPASPAADSYNPRQQAMKYAYSLQQAASGMPLAPRPTSCPTLDSLVAMEQNCNFPDSFRDALRSESEDRSTRQMVNDRPGSGRSRPVSAYTDASASSGHSASSTLISRTSNSSHRPGMPRGPIPVIPLLLPRISHGNNSPESSHAYTLSHALPCSLISRTSNSSPRPGVPRGPIPVIPLLLPRISHGNNSPESSHALISRTSNSSPRPGVPRGPIPVIPLLLPRISQSNKSPDRSSIEFKGNTRLSSHCQLPLLCTDRTDCQLMRLDSNPRTPCTMRSSSPGDE
eukprot:gene16103-22245_t